ncbi:MAG: hypothetical protein R3E79_54210 [Caldilineaceae bacterium]
MPKRPITLAAVRLPPTDEFWSAPPQPWTAQPIWGGEDLPCDHAHYG